MKRVGVRRLRDGLSKYIKRVARGERLLVTEHGKPVASLETVVDSEEDRAAAELYDDLVNWLFADPVLLGRYPASLAELLPVQEGDLATISTPLDWFGLNHYFPALVGAAAPGADLPFELGMAPAERTTDFGWPVLPDAFREMRFTSPAASTTDFARIAYHSPLRKLKASAPYARLSRVRSCTTMVRISTVALPLRTRSPICFLKSVPSKLM